jgi:hypothetical protein
MPQTKTGPSRYDVTCPICGTQFLAGRFGWEGTSFRCPACGGLLECANGSRPYFIGWIGAILSAAAAFLIGFRGWALVFITLGGSFLVLALVTSVLFHISPPKAQKKLKYGETGLRLKNKDPR